MSPGETVIAVVVIITTAFFVLGVFVAVGLSVNNAIKRTEEKLDKAFDEKFAEFRRVTGTAPRPSPPPLTKEQERRVEEARRAEEAFRTLQNYDVNDAYGLGGD